LPPLSDIEGADAQVVSAQTTGCEKGSRLEFMVTPQTHPIVGKIRDGLALSLHAQAWADATDEAARQGKERLYRSNLIAQS
jgi:hypothetical protein